MGEKIKMTCLFCKSDQFEIEEGRQYKSGDMIKCSNCGKLNDYESMLEVTKEKAMDIAKEEAKKIIDKTAKDLKKTFKNLKI